MKFIVGTTNKAKIDAVSEILKDYPHLSGAEVTSQATGSGVGDQPRSLEATVQGAMNRARNCFVSCDYSVGIESGLMTVPFTKSGYMDVCACAIYDGKEYHIGLSSAWEFPNPEITKLIMNEGLDMSQAVNKMGLTNNPTVGAAEGAIGILTKGRIDRKEYTKQALRMALIHIEEDA